MASQMNNLSQSQLAIVNKIISQGQSIGAPDTVIQAVINIANAESDFTPSAPNANGQSSAFGLFQYINTTWQSSWNKYSNSNPDNPLSQDSADQVRTDTSAQIDVAYQNAMSWYNGYND